MISEKQTVCFNSAYGKGFIKKVGIFPLGGAFVFDNYIEGRMLRVSFLYIFILAALHGLIVAVWCYSAVPVYGLWCGLAVMERWRREVTGILMWSIHQKENCYFGNPPLIENIIINQCSLFGKWFLDRCPWRNEKEEFGKYGRKNFKMIKDWI